MEGATGWETFVKVTFPSIAPHMVLALIYTIIDYSASYENETLLYISDVSYTQASWAKYRRSALSRGASWPAVFSFVSCLIMYLPIQ